MAVCGWVVPKERYSETVEKSKPRVERDSNEASVRQGLLQIRFLLRNDDRLMPPHGVTQHDLKLCVLLEVRPLLQRFVSVGFKLGLHLIELQRIYGIANIA